MACFSPLKAYKHHGGKISFGKLWDGVAVRLLLPCGQCVGCRLERSRQWAMRIMHETQMHDASCFITLTYADSNLPEYGSLRYRDFQLFMKRLRFKVGNVRFFMCGEYGETFLRPHFHACLFGIGFYDRYFWRVSPSGCDLFRSPLLDSLWDLGTAEIGELTFESAAYVARYCMKKVTGTEAEAHYEKLDCITGEVVSVIPEFARMSLKPGIGASWISKYMSDVYPFDEVVCNGMKCKPPRYYDLMLERDAPLTVGVIKSARAAKARLFQADCTPERLLVREKVTKARLSFKKRSIL